MENQIGNPLPSQPTMLLNVDFAGAHVKILWSSPSARRHSIQVNEISELEHGPSSCLETRISKLE